MLGDEDLSRRFVIGLGPELFYHRLPDDLDFLRCFSFRADERLHSYFDFHLIALPEYAGRPVVEIHAQINEVVNVPTLITFANPPTRDSFRLYNLLSRQMEILYSPALVDLYRHRNTRVVAANVPPDEMLASLLSLLSPDFS